MTDDSQDAFRCVERETTRRGALAKFGSVAGLFVGVSGAASAQSTEESSIPVDPEPPKVGQKTTFSTPSTGASTLYWGIEHPNGTTSNGRGESITVTFEEPGAYAVTHVIVSGRSVGEVTGEGTVEPAGDAKPEATIEYSPQDPAYNPITFDGSGSTVPGGTIESYEWYLRNTDRNPDMDLFDDSPNGTGETFQERLGTGYTWAVGLEVTDSNGNSARSRTTITPVDATPNAVANVFPDEVTPPNPVTLDASESTTPVGSIASYEWDIRKYDDNNNQIGSIQRTGEVVEDTWEADVLHTFTLTVTNEAGASDSVNGNFRPEA